MSVINTQELLQTFAFSPECSYDGEKGEDEQEKALLDPQGFAAEKAWAEGWILRVIQHLKTYGRVLPVVCDRGPLSSAFYCTDRDRADELMVHVRHLLATLQKTHHVTIQMWCLWADKETVWKRVVARVEREPWRLRFREDDRGHFDATWALYATHKGFDRAFHNPMALLKGLAATV